MAQKISKVVVDRDTCIGAASCVAIAPDVFDLDEDGKAIVKKGGLKTTDNETILDAAKSCPVDAVKVYGDGGQQIYP